MNSQRIHFINESDQPGQLSGQLLIEHDRTRRDWVRYELHWGDSEGQRLSNSPLLAYGVENIGTEAAPHYQVKKPLVQVFNNTPIPAQACFFLVLVVDLTGEQHLYARRSIFNQEHLLPPSATELERYLSATSGRLNQLPVVLDSLWDPHRCPTQFLPWLAWAVSIDIWPSNSDPVEEASQRREMISRNAFVHKHKGTRAAIQQALNAFTGTSIRLTEWWEETPPAAPHTFKLDLLINRAAEGAGSADLNARLRQAIDAVKPVTVPHGMPASV